MRLIEILKEAKVIENVGVLTETSKESIKKKYNSDKSKEFKMITKVDKTISKSDAIRAVKKLDDNMKKIRNEIVTAFMSGKIEDMYAILNDTKKSRESIDYLTLLKAAHGGEKKMLAAAGKKKSFMKKTLDLINNISDIKTSEDEEETETK